MLDLLGFWFNVTVITVLLCWWMVPLGAWIGDLAISQITEGEHKKLLTIKFLNSPVGRIFKQHRYDLYDDTLMLGCILTAAAAAFLGLALVDVHSNLSEELQQTTTVLSIIGDICVNLAPYTSFIAVIVLIYIMFVFVGKRVYKAMKLLNKLDKAE